MSVPGQERLLDEFRYTVQSCINYTNLTTAEILSGSLAVMIFVLSSLHMQMNVNITIHCIYYWYYQVLITMCVEFHMVSEYPSLFLFLFLPLSFSICDMVCVSERGRYKAGWRTRDRSDQVAVEDKCNTRTERKKNLRGQYG